MNVLMVIAHPSETSFTSQLAQRFTAGVQEGGHEVFTMNIFRNDVQKYSIERIQNLVSVADHICFAWPNMWEMPPAKLVDLLQTVFVKGFAFEFNGTSRNVLLNKNVTCIVSLGQHKELKAGNLIDAMTYCGLHPRFIEYKGVGPFMTPEQAEIYLQHARDQGANLT